MPHPMASSSSSEPNFFSQNNSSPHSTATIGETATQKGKRSAAAAATSSTSVGDGSTGTATATKKKNVKKRKRDDDGDDAEYKPSSTWTKERADREASRALKSRLEANPLPGFKDIITNAELIQPAISPYGHVLSYSTWLKCLASEPKNTCPFTKKPIKKRDLVILTWDNVDQYKDKIDRSGQL